METKQKIDSTPTHPHTELTPEQHHSYISLMLEGNGEKGHWFKCCCDKNIIDCHTNDKAQEIAELFSNDYNIEIEGKMMYLEAKQNV